VEDILSAHRTGLLLALCIGASLAWSQSAGAAPDTNPIGKVLTTTGTIRIEHSATILAQVNLPTEVGQVKVGDFIYRGDIIQTGPDGKLGVAFADGSSFSVSANARMEVNNFVYDPRGHSNSSLMNLTKGTFTFIAGEVAHTGSMKVETPVGTMGIRGGTARRVTARKRRSHFHDCFTSLQLWNERQAPTYNCTVPVCEKRGPPLAAQFREETPRR
jgi:hypothetical protein